MQRRTPNLGLLIFSMAVAFTVLPSAAILWRASERAFAVSLFFLGLSLGPCLSVYAVVPVIRKQHARRIVLLTGGLSILAFSILGRASLDLEGFFMLLFLGTGGAAIGHTLITVIVGPLFFGRFLCGWGCWRAMILELLPIHRSPGRLGGFWRSTRILGLVVSVGAAAVLVLIFHDHPGGSPGAMQAGSLRAIMTGFGIYYLASIGLAFVLHDQRAFCKYLCPSGLILNFASRGSLLKMTADAQLCNACGACTKVCPMDVDVAHFAVLGRPVRSGECILCQKCAHACPTNALQLRTVLHRP